MQKQQLLYLVRHGEAISKEVDAQRPLSDSGKSSVASLASCAANAGIRVDQIVHSGKRRAEQTAETLAAQLHPNKPATCLAGIGPNDDVHRFCHAVAELDQTMMVVGHLPFLSRLVSQLVVGNADQTLVQFEPAGLVELTCEDRLWTITSLVHPGRLPST